jgi:hypothetical protein
LPDSITFALRTDPAAALGALMIISSAHTELFGWAARTLCDHAPADLEPRPRRRRANGSGRVPRARKARAARKANGGRRKPGAGAADLARRREKRDAADKRLLEALKASPGGTIAVWAGVIGRSRTSTIAGLKRLRAAGAATNEDGVWALTDPPAAKETPAKWVAPVSGAARAAQHHVT